MFHKKEGGKDGDSRPGLEILGRPKVIAVERDRSDTGRSRRWLNNELDYIVEERLQDRGNPQVFGCGDY